MIYAIFMCYTILSACTPYPEFGYFTNIEDCRHVLHQYDFQDSNGPNGTHTVCMQREIPWHIVGE